MRQTQTLDPTVMTVVKVKCAVRSGHTLTTVCTAVPQAVRGKPTHGAVKLTRTSPNQVLTRARVTQSIADGKCGEFVINVSCEHGVMVDACNLGLRVHMCEG